MAPPAGGPRTPGTNLSVVARHRAGAACARRGPLRWLVPGTAPPTAPPSPATSRIPWHSGGSPIISGGAYGIDAHAHRAALAGGSSGSMPTIAVMAGGVDRFYPSGNEELLRTVANQGAVLAEVPPGSAPTRYRFLQRNRLIAALASVTVVVEARWRSGALNTAHHAETLGRAVGAVPGSVHSANSAGCHRLLREGGAVCVTDAGEVAELASPSGESLPEVKSRPGGRPGRADPGGPHPAGRPAAAGHHLSRKAHRRRGTYPRIPSARAWAGSDCWVWPSRTAAAGSGPARQA